MPDDSGPAYRFATRLSHAGRKGTKVRSFVNPPVYRGSVLRADALQSVIAEIEGGTHCQIVSSGLAAVTTSLLAHLKSGDHCLMPESVAGTARAFAEGMLRDLGIETTFYDPSIDPAGLERLLRSTTAVLYLESLSDQTFAPQDVPALAAVARRQGVAVLLDNTGGIHHFQPFQHGVDLSIQALMGPDVQLGAITVADQGQWDRIKQAASSLGQSAGADDCWLCLRSLRSLGVRLAQQSQSALLVAEWLQTRPEVRQVLFPALPGAPGHEVWKRDFTGAGNVFGVAFQPHVATPALRAVMVGDHIARFQIGLEDPTELIADLKQAFEAPYDH